LNGYAVFGFANYNEKSNRHPYVGSIKQQLDANDTVLLLLGNYHSRKDPQSPLGILSSARENLILHSYVAESPNYQTWACVDGAACGPQTVGASFCTGVEEVSVDGLDIRFSINKDHKYWDGCIHFDKTTPSYPAN
jgi:hypothetical protein